MALEQICGLAGKPFMRTMYDENVLIYEAEYKWVKDVFKSPYDIRAPPYSDPRVLTNILEKGNMPLTMLEGTTTLGFKYNGGIILCMDSRGTTGNFIASQEMKKIIEVDKHILGTIAGGAADCTYWDRVLAIKCHLYDLNYGEPISVTTAANILANIILKHAGLGLNMGMMLAGYDFDEPKLVYIDSDGYQAEGNLFSVGSGMNHALSILDAFYKWHMTDKDAYFLALHAIFHSAVLDPHTGGLVRLYHMRSNGWEEVTVTDCMNLGNFTMKDDKATPAPKTNA